jgi:hypothetical protein
LLLVSIDVFRADSLDRGLTPTLPDDGNFATMEPMLEPSPG